MSSRRHITTLLALTALLALTTPALFAQAELPRKELTEKVTTGLGKLTPLLEAKDYTGALALVEGLMPVAPPGTFDVYILNQLKSQILLTLGKMDESIPFMETTLAMAEVNPNFADASAQLDLIDALSRLHYQKASESKGDAQKAGYEKALGFVNRWIALSPKPSSDVRLLASSLHYQLATLNPAKPDASHLRSAIAQAKEGMLVTVKPSDQISLMVVACHLQLGENAQAAELLEILALRDPKNPSHWNQLQSIYMAAAGDTKNPEELRTQSLRALITIDRAQANGLLNTPRDNYTRVAILFNIQQYSSAAALLEKGLADNSLENSKRNWELLASAYQQINLDAKALTTLTKATSIFPKDAELEFSLAQFLYNTGNVKDAYTRGKAALEKGLAKRGQSQVYLAYLAFELQRYEEAMTWVDAARASGEVPAATIDQISKAVADSLRARESLTRS